MGFLDRKWAETSRRLQEQLQPFVTPGETLIGVVHANEANSFSAKLYAVGVTDQRLLLLPVDRKMRPAASAPDTIERDEIVASSIWGWQGSVADFLSGSADQQIRIETVVHKYKLMVLGDNMLENSLAGEAQLRGLDALVEFVLSARPETSR